MFEDRDVEVFVIPSRPLLSYLLFETKLFLKTNPISQKATSGIALFVHKTANFFDTIGGAFDEGSDTGDSIKSLGASIHHHNEVVWLRASSSS